MIAAVNLPEETPKSGRHHGWGAAVCDKWPPAKGMAS